MATIRKCSGSVASKRRAKPKHPNRELFVLRINAGLSREDLGRRVGISREAVRLAEIGYVPGPRIQFALADAFGKQPLDLWPLERQKALA